MFPPIPRLEDYDVSPEFGFLPAELPLDILPDPYYNRWEAVVANLQALLLSKRLRGVVERIPILSTSRLHDASEWRRAYMLLSFMTHGYIWGGEHPQEVNHTITHFIQLLTGHAESPAVFVCPIPQSLQIS